METPVKVTISRRGSIKGEGVITISIDDHASGAKVVELDMTYADFAECITGMSYSDGVASFIPTEYSTSLYGKTKKVGHVEIPISERLSKDTPDTFFDQYIPDGWSLWSNGLRTQQNKKGVHCITICKYE